MKKKGEVKRNPISDLISVKSADGSGHSMPKKRKWWHFFVMYPALITAIIGAIPQYNNWVTAFRLGIPSDSLAVAKEQVQLWNKNFECSRENDLKCIKTKMNHEIGALVCPSGDVLIKILSPEKGKPYYRWIGLDTFLNSGSIWGPGIAEGKTLFFNESIILAKSEYVLCQRRDSNNNIIRTIKDSEGKCWEETINITTGKVTQRRRVSCDAPCEK